MTATQTRACKSADESPETPTATLSAPQPESDTITHESIASALSAFQSEAPTVHKGSEADAGSYTYKYADLASMAKASYPLLARHGLSFTAPPTLVDGKLMLNGILMHTSGEMIEGMLPISGSNAQALGSSITYMRRYLFGCLTGLVSDADDDGAAAKQEQQNTERLQREHAERVERERRAAAEQRERDKTVATAAPEVVAQLRSDVLLYADTISNALTRKESLLAVWSDATRAGALGSEVLIPEPWVQHTNAPTATCLLHQLISGAADVSLPPSGESKPAPEETDPWATEAKR